MSKAHWWGWPRDTEKAYPPEKTASAVERVVGTVEEMACYVDDLFPTPRSERWKHAQACHLMADTDEELHAMATELGLKKSDARGLGSAHQHEHRYELTAAQRRKAVAAGAIEETRVGAAMRIAAAARADSREDGRVG